jgi:hypothetical protein
MYTQRNRPTTPSNKKERSPATDTQICMQRFEHARDTTSYFEMVEYLLSHHRFRHPQKKNKTATEHTNKNKEQQNIYIHIYFAPLNDSETARWLSKWALDGDPKTSPTVFYENLYHLIQPLGCPVMM